MIYRINSVSCMHRTSKTEIKAVSGLFWEVAVWAVHVFCNKVWMTLKNSTVNTVDITLVSFGCLHFIKNDPYTVHIKCICNKARVTSKNVQLLLWGGRKFGMFCVGLLFVCNVDLKISHCSCLYIVLEETGDRVRGIIRATGFECF